MVGSRAGGSSASRSGHDAHRGQDPRASSSPRARSLLCALAGRGLGRRHQQSLAAGHRQHPANLLVLFQQASAASPCGVPWTLLAAVAKTESSFDATAVSSAGAEGMFQFEPATFAEYAKPTPSGGAVPPTPFDPTDAAYAAARYLCSLGVADEPDPGVGGLQLRQRRSRRARPPRPATPNRCWPPLPATPRRVRECRAASRPPWWPTPSRRSEPPTSTAGDRPGPGSTAPDWWCGPTGWPGWSCPGWQTTSGTTSPTWT